MHQVVDLPMPPPDGNSSSNSAAVHHIDYELVLVSASQCSYAVAACCRSQ